MSEAPGAPAQKIIWPLFLVAALSFVPFLGVFFGAAGATWGLISTRRKAIWAAVISLAGALANIAWFMVLAFGSKGKTSVAADTRFTQRELADIVRVLERYHDKEHAYPVSLRMLQQRMVLSSLVPILDMSGAGFHLPHEYHYVLAADGESYDLSATGPDNLIGTADDIRPVLSDSLKAHSGYRPLTVTGKP